jgi:thiol-disulfide isomerase/thioredoxin
MTLTFTQTVDGVNKRDLSESAYSVLSATEQSNYISINSAVDLGDNLNFYIPEAPVDSTPVAADTSAASWTEFEKKVPVLSSTDALEEFITDNANSVVLFFAPWCPNSSILRPQLLKGIGKLLNKGVVVSAPDNCTFLLAQSICLRPLLLFTNSKFKFSILHSSVVGLRSSQLVPFTAWRSGLRCVLGFMRVRGRDCLPNTDALPPVQRDATFYLNHFPTHH